MDKKIKLKDFMDRNIYLKQNKLIQLQKKRILTCDEELELNKLDIELNLLYQIQEICEDRGRY